MCGSICLGLTFYTELLSNYFMNSIQGLICLKVSSTFMQMYCLVWLRYIVKYLMMYHDFLSYHEKYFGLLMLLRMVVLKIVTCIICEKPTNLFVPILVM